MKRENLNFTPWDHNFRARLAGVHVKATVTGQ